MSAMGIVVSLGQGPWTSTCAHRGQSSR